MGSLKYDKINSLLDFFLVRNWCIDNQQDQYAAYTYISDSADISETEGVLWDGLLGDDVLKVDPDLV